MLLKFKNYNKINIFIFNLLINKYIFYKLKVIY